MHDSAVLMDLLIQLLSLLLTDLLWKHVTENSWKVSFLTILSIKNVYLILNFAEEFITDYLIFIRKKI